MSSPIAPENKETVLYLWSVMSCPLKIRALACTLDYNPIVFLCPPEHVVVSTELSRCCTMRTPRQIGTLERVQRHELKIQRQSGGSVKRTPNADRFHRKP